ncbi:hypothetical protein FGO68_gene6088 [Halteria grandinella]|uniref:Uncharacterized protein n=1 Tax=Halteria grandinella TaxID=5974 RepID=A0A8J8SVK3_HALGN|nr:hypothetical protein FGO68_gene6088 [Halteria grandinella]
MYFNETLNTNQLLFSLPLMSIIDGFTCTLSIKSFLIEIERRNLQEELQLTQLSGYPDDGHFDTNLGFILTGLPLESEVNLRFKDEIVNEAGLQLKYSKSIPITNKHVGETLLSLEHYTNYESIFQQLTQPEVQSLHAVNFGDFPSNILEQAPDDMVYLYFQVQTKALIYKRYPDQFLHALVKIGGLIGLLKIFFIVRQFHMRTFEKEIAKAYQNAYNDAGIKGEAINLTVDKVDTITQSFLSEGSKIRQQKQSKNLKYEDLFTFENVISMAKENQELRKAMNLMDRELRELKGRLLRVENEFKQA